MSRQKHDRQHMRSKTAALTRETRRTDMSWVTFITTFKAMEEHAAVASLTAHYGQVRINLSCDTHIQQLTHCYWGLQLTGHRSS